MAIFRGLRLRGGRSEKSKPARDEQSGANAFANPLTKPGYFDGHTPAEAWLFMLNAVWMPLPLLLRLWPATFNWLPRVGAVSSLPSWLACASHCASIAHWSAYRPGSIAQHVDIILAGALMLASAHSPRALPETNSQSHSATIAHAPYPLSHTPCWCFAFSWAALKEVWELTLAVTSAEELAEAQQLLLLCFFMFALAFLDVKHKELFATTHVTGTWLHYALRNVGFDVIMRLGGAPDGGGARAWVTILYVVPFAHALLSYASGRWMRLDGRDEPPSAIECAVGLALSYAVVVAAVFAL